MVLSLSRSLLLPLLGLLFSLSVSATVELTLAEQHWLQQHPVLKVQSLNAFPPFNYVEDGEPKGYSIDYMRLLAQELGVTIEFVSNKAWHEHLEMLKAGTLDLIPHIAATEERKAFVDFTSFNHVTFTTGIAINSGQKIASADDLQDKVVAVANKTFLHTYLSKNYPELKLLLTGSTQEAVKTVSQGRADAVVGSLPALHYYIQKDWLSNVRIASISDIKLPDITELPMGVAKGNHLLLSILEKGHKALSHRELSALKQKWMHTDTEQLLDAGLTAQEREYLRQKAELRVCIDPNWMPLEGIVDGRHQGMTADYLAHFQKFIGVPMRFVTSQSWSESLKAGAEGRCDLFSLIMQTEEREAYLDFTNTYMSLPLVMVTSLNQPFISDLGVLDDKKIGIASGFAIKPLLQSRFPQLQFVDVADAREGLRKVARGDLFGYADALPVVGHLIQQTYLGELKVSGRFDENWELGIGTDKAQPLLASIFNKAIMQLGREEHLGIQNRWVAINYQQAVDYTLVWQLLMVFAVIAGLLIYRNRSVARLNAKLEMANEMISSRQKMVDRYVMITTFDTSGHILSANSAFCKTLGYEEGEILGYPMTRFVPSELPLDYLDYIWEQLRTRQTWTGEVKCASKCGDIVSLRVNIEPMLRNNEVAGYRAISENITDRKRIEELSVTDALTGLNNRHKIDALLTEQMERHERHGLEFAVLLLDIDDFKQVNDSHGHDEGDRLLQAFATILKNNIRKIDRVGRWGGEEFVVICENTSAENALILAEKLRNIVAHSDFGVAGQKTISIGVSALRQGDSLNALFKRADQALYRAKYAGKNRVELEQLEPEQKKGFRRSPEGCER